MLLLYTEKCMQKYKFADRGDPLTRWGLSTASKKCRNKSQNHWTTERITWMTIVFRRKLLVVDGDCMSWILQPIHVSAGRVCSSGDTPTHACHTALEGLSCGVDECVPGASFLIWTELYSKTSPFALVLSGTAIWLLIEHLPVY